MRSLRKTVFRPTRSSLRKQSGIHQIPSAGWWRVSDSAALPGSKGTRIVCLANFRPEKDHFTLVAAMARVVKEVPAADLILVGDGNHPAYQRLVEKEISHLGLERNVSILGERHDVSGILKACDIGVLSRLRDSQCRSSSMECGLAAVATSVGQCVDVLDQGRAGILVPPQAVHSLSAALVSLLQSADARFKFAEIFRARVNETYSAAAVIGDFCKIYETLDRKRRSHAGNTPIRCDLPKSTTSP